LKQRLKELGLSRKGNKPELVQRLQDAADDAASSSESEESMSEGFDLLMDDTDAGCDKTDYEDYDCTNLDCPCAIELIPSSRAKTHVTLKLWLAADYKFLLVVLGFKGATCKFPCIFCKANLSDPREWKVPRPLDERSATGPADPDFSQHCVNLFPFIPRDRCRIDILHMLLRCMDRFIHYAAIVYLRSWVPQLDTDEDKLKALNAGLGKAFAAAAGQGSITFAEKSGSTKTWKLIRVNGNGYKRILENFRFADSLPKEHAETAKMHQDVWDSFNDIYTHVNTTKPWGWEQVRDTIRIWFSKCVGGYIDSNSTKVLKNKPLILASYLLTPYFHCLLCHVPQMVQYREIYSFTGQNFEKGNHTHQRIHAAASHHIDDNRLVMEQNLRVLLNKVGTVTDHAKAVPCDSPDCSRTFKTEGSWMNHWLREHHADLTEGLILMRWQPIGKLELGSGRFLTLRPPTPT